MIARWQLGPEAPQIMVIELFLGWLADAIDGEETRVEALGQAHNVATFASSIPALVDDNDRATLLSELKLKRPQRILQHRQFPVIDGFFQGERQIDRLQHSAPPTFNLRYAITEL